jgi:hypothetical protein
MNPHSGLRGRMPKLSGDELESSAVATAKDKAKPLFDWTLADILRAAKSANWLPAGLDPGADWNTKLAHIGDYADVLRQIRNLIHDSRYLQDRSPSRITHEVYDVKHGHRRVG